METDAEGMRPDSLRKVLSRWKPEDAKKEKSDIPRVIYTIPNGVNPTGNSLSVPRRKEIYQVCRLLLVSFKIQVLVTNTGMVR